MPKFGRCIESLANYRSLRQIPQIVLNNSPVIRKPHQIYYRTKSEASVGILAFNDIFQKMTETSVFECHICNSPYGERQCRPLSLPCGHVFCEECLLSSVVGSDIVCPFDKHSHTMKVEALPVCYAILSNLPRERNREVNCARHPRKKVKFLCKTHDKFLCSDCIIEHTGTGHNVVAYNLQSAQLRAELEELEHKYAKKARVLQDAVRTLESCEKKVKPFYEAQAAKVNSAYDSAVKTLGAKRKEHLATLQRYSSEQLKQLESSRSSTTKLHSVALSGYQSVAKFKEELGSHNYEEFHSFFQGMLRETERINEAVSIPDLQFWAFKSKTNSDDLKLWDLGCVIKVDDKLNENDSWICHSCLHQNCNTAKHCYLCRKRKAVKVQCSPNSKKDLASPGSSGVITARGRQASKTDKELCTITDDGKEMKPVVSPRNMSSIHRSKIEVPAKRRVRQHSRHRHKHNNSF